MDGFLAAYPELARCQAAGSAARGSRFPQQTPVVVTRQPDEDCLMLFAAQGYDREEVFEYFDHAGARSFAIYTQDCPVCACLASRNFGRVYEIGALYTLPQERRKGLARQVILAALAWVTGSGNIPRYAVHEQNVASLHLAESIRLAQFLVTEHWVTRSPGEHYL